MSVFLVRGRLPHVLAWSLGLLLLLWFWPHTSGLRYSLIVLLLGGALSVSSGVRWQVWEVLQSGPVRVLWGLSAWLVIQALFWAWFPTETWQELQGQWLKSIVILITGVAIATALNLHHRRHYLALQVVYLSLTLVLLLQLGGYAVTWITTGQSPLSTVGLFGFKTEISYLANILFGITLAEGFARLLQTRPTLNVPLAGLWLSGLVAVAVTVCSGARNGMIGMAALFVSTALLAHFLAPRAARQQSGLLRYWPALALIAVVAVGIASWKLDSRWQRLSETVPIAMHTADHPSWLDSTRYPWPTLKDGQTVEISAYERIAFLTEGLRASADLPWGLGFTRKAFSHAMEARFGLPSRHAHSGMVEWLLAMGWVGMLAWMVSLMWILKRALAHFFRERSALGLVVAFMISGFASRMLIENITRDLTLELFMLLTGILLATLHKEAQHSLSGLR